jgi:ubiquinone biosynthesis protein Coq4
VRKATSLQNRAKDIRQQQLQQQAITETFFLENSRTKRGDVSDLQELEAVREHMEMLQTMSDSLREQQFQAILELGVELYKIFYKK